MGLSTVAAADPEEIGPVAGNMGWFQLYPPKDPAIRRDMLQRIKNAGHGKAAKNVTISVPTVRENCVQLPLSASVP